LDITFINSPNYFKGRRNYTPIAIVIHIMEGTLTGTDSWFLDEKSKVSAHFGIGKDGAVHQYVHQSDTAWHAGRVNNPSWKLIKPSGDAANPYINPNYYTLGIEHEGDEHSDWTDDMYQSSSQVIAALSKRWNIPLDREHVIGHHEIYSLKTCPGFKVDLDKLINLASQVKDVPVIQEPVQPSPEPEDGHTDQEPVPSNPTPLDSDTTKEPVSSPPVYNIYNKVAKAGKATTAGYLYIRSGPGQNLPVIAVAPPGIQLAFDGYVDNGMPVNNNARWYYTNEGNWFWSGAVK
jgi:hypothetical protein